MNIQDRETVYTYCELVNIKEDEYKDEYIEQTLQRIPFFERTCLLLQIEGEFAIQDIADIVGKSQEEVSAAICDAREHVCQHYHVLLEQEKRVQHFLPSRNAGSAEKRALRPIREGTHLQRQRRFRSILRTVLIAAVICIGTLIIPMHTVFSPLVEAKPFLRDVPSKTQTFSRFAWAHSVAWSPNGEDIATLWSDNTMQVWDARNGIERFHVNDIGWGAGLAFSPDDGRYLASVDTDTTFQIFDVTACDKTRSGTCRPLFVYRGHEGPIEALAWSPDGTKIASASDDGTVRIWDIRTGDVLSVYQDQTPQAMFTTVAWSPDGRRIVSGDNRGFVQIRDALTGQLLLNYLGHHNDPVTFASWSYNGKYIASSGYRGIVRIWDAQTGQTLASIPGTEGGSVMGSGNNPVYAAVWSHRNSLIAIASYDVIQVWDFSGGRLQQIGKGYHPSADSPDSEFAHAVAIKSPINVFTVAWSPDDQQIVCGGQGYTLKLNTHA